MKLTCATINNVCRPVAIRQTEISLRYEGTGNRFWNNGDASYRDPMNDMLWLRPEMVEVPTDEPPKP